MDAVGIAVGSSKRLVSAPQLDFGLLAAPQVLAVGLASVSTQPFSLGNTVVRITPTQNVWFTVGPTAAQHVAGNDYLAANTTWLMKIPAGAVLSFIADTLAGYVAIAAAVSPPAPGVAVAVPASALAFDFTTGTLDPSITFARATTATYFDNTGTLQTAASGAARFDYDPVALTPRGLLIEEARTNAIRNNTMQGAVAGTPGTVPTNWGIGSGIGFNRQIVGTGTENGITFIDVKYTGTPTSSGNVVIDFDSGVTQAASPGQVWTSSHFVRVASGSLANAGVFIQTQARNSGGTLLGGGITVNATTAVAAATSLATNRVVATGTLSDAATAFVAARMFLNMTNGNPVDFTLRIGLPQLELGAAASSPIATSTVAVTRNADQAYIANPPGVNPNEGTLFYDSEMTSLSNSGNNVYGGISDGTFANSKYWNYNGTSYFWSGVGGNVGITLPLAIGARLKMAGTYKLNVANLAAVNSTVNTGAAQSALPGMTRISIGCNVWQLPPGNQINGHVRAFAYYSSALSPNQLALITT